MRRNKGNEPLEERGNEHANIIIARVRGPFRNGEQRLERAFRDARGSSSALLKASGGTQAIMILKENSITFSITRLSGRKIGSKTSGSDSWTVKTLILGVSLFLASPRE